MLHVWVRYLLLIQLNAVPFQNNSFVVFYLCLGPIEPFSSVLFPRLLAWDRIRNLVYNYLKE